MAFHRERLGGADLAGLPFVRKTDLRERTLLALEELAPHYQLVVDRAATLARLEVQVETAPAHRALRWLRRRPSGDHVARRRAAEQLRQATRLSVELSIVAPRTIPRSEGKAVRVIERG